MHTNKSVIHPSANGGVYLKIFTPTNKLTIFPPFKHKLLTENYLSNDIDIPSNKYFKLSFQNGQIEGEVSEPIYQKTTRV